MNRSLIGAIGASIALCTVVSSAGAQDGCGGAVEGVDLAVQSARLRQRDDGWVVLYTVINRGRMASTSYNVSLKIDGVESTEDEYLVGLEPGHRRRWELSLPEAATSPDGHEVRVQVSTATKESAAGPSYADQCALNDELPGVLVGAATQRLRGTDSGCLLIRPGPGALKSHPVRLHVLTTTDHYRPSRGIARGS